MCVVCLPWRDNCLELLGAAYAMWLDPPVITREGDTLKISREAHWGPKKAATCLYLSLWLVAWAFAEFRVGRSVLLGIPEPHKAPPGLFGWIWLLLWTCAGLITLRSWHRMVFLEGEEISVDTREFRVFRNWAGGDSKARCYPVADVSNLRSRHRGLFGRYVYSIGFDFRGKSIWFEPCEDEPEQLTMLDALQEHLSRQQVQ